MKIKKFAGGGITYLPTTNRVAEETVKTTTASSEDSSKKSKVIDKLFDLIKEKGLDSDVAKFTNAIEIKLQMGLDPNGENLTQRDLVQLAQMASSVTTNYERYNTAVKNLTAQNAESDVAIDDRGRIYCYNVETKKVSALTPDKIKEQKDSIQILTNAELLNLRRSNSELAYNTKILDDINNAVGIDTITKYLQETIAKFKTSNVEGYSEKQQNAIASGLQALVGGDVDAKTLAAVQAGPDGVYKIKSTDTIADQNIKMALNYLQSSLPNKMKRKLETTAIVEGYDPSAFMITMLAANTERSFTANWEGQVDKDGKLSKTTASEKEGSMVQDSVANMFAKGDLTETTTSIVPVASRVADQAGMIVHAWNGGPMQDKDGKGLYANNLESLIPQVEQLKACDTSSITFGNQRLKPEDKSKVVWDGTSKVMRVSLPAKKDHGQVVPDFDMVLTLNELNRWVSENPGISDLEINNKLKELETDGVTYNPNTKTFNCTNTAFFATFAGYASDTILDIQEQSKPFLEKKDRAFGADYADKYNNYVQHGKPDPAKKATPINDYSGAKKRSFYYGNIYIPIVDPVQGVIMTVGQYRPKSEFAHPAQTNAVGQQIVAAEQNSNWRTNL